MKLLNDGTQGSCSALQGRKTELKDGIAPVILNIVLKSSKHYK